MIIHDVIHFEQLIRMYIPAEEIEPPEGVTKSGVGGIAHLLHTHATIKHLLRVLLEAGIAVNHFFLVERHTRNIHLFFQVSIEKGCFLIVNRHWLFLMQCGIVKETRPE